jgi:hypothetical protein
VKTAAEVLRVRHPEFCAALAKRLHERCFLTVALVERRSERRHRQVAARILELFDLPGSGPFWSAPATFLPPRRRLLTRMLISLG